jgi:hypothetical protein
LGSEDSAITPDYGFQGVAALPAHGLRGVFSESQSQRQ